MAPRRGRRGNKTNTTERRPNTPPPPPEEEENEEESAASNQEEDGRGPAAPSSSQATQASSLEALPQPTFKDKRKRNDPVLFTEQQEQEVADWYRENEILYNPKLKDYKNTALKQRLMKEKATDLDINEVQLLTWLKSMRTAVSKLTDPNKKKSGNEAIVLSDRQKWIMANFGFLKGYIKRVNKGKRKIGGQLSQNLASSSLRMRQTPEDTEDDEADSESDNDVNDVSDADGRESDTSRASTAFSSPSARKGGPYKKSKKITSSCSSAVSEFIGQARTIQRELQNIADTPPSPAMNSQTQARRHFADLIFHETMLIDDITWTDYQTQSFHMLMAFKQGHHQSYQLSAGPPPPHQHFSGPTSSHQQFASSFPRSRHQSYAPLQQQQQQQLRAPNPAQSPSSSRPALGSPSSLSSTIAQAWQSVHSFSPIPSQNFADESNAYTSFHNLPTGTTPGSNSSGPSTSSPQNKRDDEGKHATMNL